MKDRFASILLVALLASPALGQVEYVATLSEETYSFAPDFGVLFSVPRIEANFPIPDFTFDFGTVGETEVRVTAKAPDGYMIAIAPPVNFGSTRSMQFFFDTVGPSVPSLSNSMFEFTSPFGPSLPAPDITNISMNGDRVTGIADFSSLTPGLTYYVTSLSVIGTAPADFDDNLNVAFDVFRLTGSTTAPLGTPDPGPWITLQPIPEPSSLALLCLGGLIVCRRHRIANRFHRVPIAAAVLISGVGLSDVAQAQIVYGLIDGAAGDQNGHTLAGTITFDSACGFACTESNVTDFSFSVTGPTNYAYSFTPNNFDVMIVDGALNATTSGLFFDFDAGIFSELTLRNGAAGTNILTWQTQTNAYLSTLDGIDSAWFDASPTGTIQIGFVIPEPASLTLVGLGGLLVARRRWRGDLLPSHPPARLEPCYRSFLKIDHESLEAAAI